ncbi:MAG: 5-(carboxyamino)imidazole ribonucleotide synthase [Ignavibacteriae bacterium HGW-Ignavibacteriae-3]|nr:MAG: 5-(carboxyamino)imidazole ribonucleotide synthase [Ignavibacteriae bacterium HGW-Ignavibacteriae-3]
MNKRSQKKIGILGGGQLARMSAYQAYKLGLDIVVLEKTKKSPAGMLTQNEFVGRVEDKKLLKKFAQSCDVVTLENEFVDYHLLESIEKLGVKVIPSSKTIGTIQDKYLQKSALRKKGIPVPKFIEIKSSDDYSKIRTVLGKKFILKSRKMGYDGYGNAEVKKQSDFKTAVEKLSSRHNLLMAEEFVKFRKELAIMVVRTKKEVKVYPVVETIQRDHICHIVLAPAKVSSIIYKKAEEIAVECVKAVNGYGIYGIEMFLTENGNILVNEMAPRPHNSGHYTIEACVTSQFENHVRSVLELPLGSTAMVKPVSVMINLLGKKTGEGILDNYSEVLDDPDIHLHIYGKADSRIGRKMGHITLVGENMNSLLVKAKEIDLIAKI